MCPHFFLFFSILGPSCVHIFFLIAHASLLLFFNRNWGERPTHIVEHLFCGMSGWYNANFSKKHSKGVYGVHVNLDHESMTKISLKGHNNLTKLNAKTSSICVYGFQEVSSYGFGRTLAYQRGASQRVF